MHGGMHEGVQRGTQRCEEVCKGEHRYAEVFRPRVSSLFKLLAEATLHTYWGDKQASLHSMDASWMHCRYI